MPSANTNRNQIVVSVQSSVIRVSVNTTRIDAVAKSSGIPGTNGTNGVGVPVGGTANQVLAKIDSANYNTQWVNQTGGGGSGTVTSVSATGNNGVTVAGSPIMTSGNLSIGLGAIMPMSVASSGTVTGSNLSGTNTGDETVTTIKSKLGITTLSGSNTGDQTIPTSLPPNGTAGGDLAGTYPNPTLAIVNSNVGTFGSASSTIIETVDAKGRNTSISATPIQIAESQVTNLTSDLASKLTNITGLITAGSNVTISGAGTSASPYNISSTAAGGGGGTVTNVSSADANATVINQTTTPIITVVSAPKLFTARTINGVSFDGTANITVADATKTPTTRTITAGTGLSGGGDLSADRTVALANTAVTPGSYTNTNLTVDAQGRITAASNGTGGGGSGITRMVVNISTNTTAGSSSAIDYVYFVSAGAVLTLPTAVGNTNRYAVNNDGATNITVNTTSSQTINGSSSAVLLPNESREFISNNANWKVF